MNTDEITSLFCLAEEFYTAPVSGREAPGDERFMNLRPLTKTVNYPKRVIGFDESNNKKPIYADAPPKYPNWRDLYQDTKDLAREFKDTEVITFVLQAELVKNGLPGLASALHYALETFRTYWDSLTPLPEDGDYFARIGILRALDTPAELPRLIGEVPIAKLPLIGDITCRSLMLTEGEIESKHPRENDQTFTRAQLEAAFSDGAETQKKLQHNLQATRFAAARLEELQSFIFDHTEAEKETASESKQVLTSTLSMLQSLIRALSTYSAERVTDPITNDEAGEGEAPADMPATIPAPAPIPVKPLTIPDDATALNFMEEIAAFYRETDTSSPIPMILAEVRALIHKPFSDVLAAIAADGLDQAAVRVNGHAAPQAAPVPFAVSSETHTALGEARQLISTVPELPIEAVLALKSALDRIEDALTQSNTSSSGDGKITSQREVTKRLQELVSYFEARHPSSPLAGFLQRTIAFVGAPFSDIVRELAPNGGTILELRLIPRSENSDDIQQTNQTGSSSS